MVGELPLSGIGTPLDKSEAPSVSDLRRNCHERNHALLNSLREDERSSELLVNTLKDAALGRMTHPQAIGVCDLRSTLLHPRFGVAQEKLDGSLKLRAVDHFSWGRTKRSFWASKTAMLSLSSNERRATSVTTHTFRRPSGRVGASRWPSITRYHF